MSEPRKLNRGSASAPQGQGQSQAAQSPYQASYQGRVQRPQQNERAQRPIQSGSAQRPAQNYFANQGQAAQGGYTPRAAQQPASGYPAQNTAQPYRAAAGQQAAQQTSQAARTAAQQEQDAYEAARQRARQLAAQNAQRRLAQQPVRSTQAAQAQRAAQQAQAPAPQETPQAPQEPRPLTRAQQQALAYRRAAEQKYGDTASFNPVRTVREEQAAQQQARAQRLTTQTQQLDLKKTKSAKPAYDYNTDPAYQQAMLANEPEEGESAQFAIPGTAQQPAPRTPKAKAPKAAAGGGGGGKPPKKGKGGRGGHDDRDDAPKGKKGKKGKGAGPYDGNGQKKKKGGCLRAAIITLLVIVLIFGGTYVFIMSAIAPKTGAISISQLINTPKEYAGDYLNIVLMGVDWEEDRAEMYSDSANDGMTDMIMYVHMDFVEGSVKMLQIPRNTLVTSDASFAGNYQINSVARTQGSDGNNNYSATCTLIYDQWKLPVDGYIALNMQSFKEIVDTLGGIEVYVPQDIDNGKGSMLSAGYQTMNGEAAEFFVRNRYGAGYANSDLDRLNMQRYVYSGLFRRLKTMTMWDVARMMPLFVKYVETDLSANDIISLGVSLLKMDSSNMMMCQMPVYLGVPEYNGNSVVAAARQEDADLLNQYFRGTTGLVESSALGDCFDLVSTDGLTASDPNVQFMGDLNAQAADAQQNQNLDGSAQVTYVDPTPVPEETTDSTESTEPAA